MKTINITLKIDPTEILSFEDVLRNRYEVISFKHLPNTEKLYETDPLFKRMVKNVKDAQRVRDEYINNMN